ncbi:MAG TPA: OmpA family protein [Rhodospirillaceae bacterium]|nr:OmpA family protein [Rhodospirillaceae bacterium]
MPRSFQHYAPALLLAGLAACAAPPATNPALGAAQQRLSRDQQDPVIREKANAALTGAEQAVTAAGIAFRDNDPTALQHQLYLADRQLATAEAEGRTATSRAEAASQARNDAELGAYKTRETDEGTLVSLYGLPFEEGQATLRPGAALRLQPLADYLKTHPDRQVMVRGNSDSAGSPAVNQALSQSRADAVRDFLVSAGVPPDRVKAQGLGAEFPLASNATAAGRQANRRVDVVIEPPSSTAALPAGR